MGNKIFMFIFMLLLILVIGWSSYNMLNPEETEKEYQVAVILRDSDSDRSVAFRQGLLQGASEYNIKLNIISEDYARSQVKEQVEKGVNGVIIDPNTQTNLSDYLMENNDNVKYVLMNTDLDPGELFPLVSAGNERIGVEMYRTLKERFPDTENARIAVVCLSGENTGEYKRYLAFKEAMDTDGVLPELTITEVDDILGILVGYLGIGGLDCVVAFDSVTTELCIDSILLSGDGGTTDLIGEGYSEKIIYYLDKGIADEIILPNEFNIGYYSIKTMYSLLQPGAKTEDIPEIELFRVTRENMYEREMENIIFPIAQ